MYCFCAVYQSSVSKSFSKKKGELRSVARLNPTCIWANPKGGRLGPKGERDHTMPFRNGVGKSASSLSRPASNRFPQQEQRPCQTSESSPLDTIFSSSFVLQIALSPAQIALSPAQNRKPILRPWRQGSYSSGGLSWVSEMEVVESSIERAAF